MLESLTEGARRALERAQTRARGRGSAQVEPVDLLAALVDEAESRAAALLGEHGLKPDRVLTALAVVPVPDPDDDEDSGESLPSSADLKLALGDAGLRARALDRSRSVGTEHLLSGLLATCGPEAERLIQAGLDAKSLLTQFQETTRAESSPLPLPVDIPPPELADPGETADLGRILDASANRAREGLRVVEDYVRFVLDDPMLTKRLKNVRHRLTEALRGLDPDQMIGSRDTPGDVGTHIMTAAEQTRENPRAVLSANFKRTGEALRSLEEYTKLTDVWLSGRFEVLRYDLYTLEKLTLTAAASYRGLGEARLYVLVGGLPTLGDLNWIVGEALAGGAQVIQLREKGLPDREVLRRAAEVRHLTRQAHARFILNDRPDLAVIAGADGVHLGQEDVSIRDARRVLGPTSLIGMSTHQSDQLDSALLDAPGYLGVGPVFPSATKDFDHLAGLDFVRQAAATTSLPWFAIGGITEENIDEVLEAGARRVAVSSSVVRADRPRRAAAALRDRLDEVAEE